MTETYAFEKHIDSLISQYKKRTNLYLHRTKYNQENKRRSHD